MRMEKRNKRSRTAKSRSIVSASLLRKLELQEFMLLQLHNDQVLKSARGISRQISRLEYLLDYRAKLTREQFLVLVEQNNFYLKEICSIYRQTLQQLEDCTLHTQQ